MKDEKEKENGLIVKAQEVITATPQSKKELFIDLQKYQKLLHKQVKTTDLQEHNGNKYLPIAYMENLMDELFFGQWSQTDFKWQQILNEIVGSITIEYLHPVSGHWLKRTGAASIVITQKKDTDLIDFNKFKQKNALDNQFPALKSLCFRNACLSIGKSFGRDVNRKHFDEYSPLIPDEIPIMENEMFEEIDRIETIEALEDYINKNKQYANNPIFKKTMVDQRKKISK